MKTRAYYKTIHWKAILLFFAFACLLTYLMTHLPNFVRLFYVSAFNIAVPFNMNHGFAVFIASIIAYRLFKIRKQTSFLGNRPLKSILFSIVFLMAYTVIGFSNKLGINPHLWAFLFCLMTLFYDILEEYAWRGFLNDALFPLPTWLKGMITGTLWGFWHLLIFDNFNQFGGLLIFLLLCILVSIIVAYATDRTKSILVASSIHALMILRDINVTLICAVLWVILILIWKKSLNKYIKQP